MVDLDVVGGFQSVTGDVIYGFERVCGTKHADTLTGNDESKDLHGGAGLIFWTAAMEIISCSAVPGGDILIGGRGNDRASYEHATTGVTANLQDADRTTGFAAGDTYVSIENLFGSRFDDCLYGDGAANVIWGDNGEDRIDGGYGHDTISCGRGDDRL